MSDDKLDVTITAIGHRIMSQDNRATDSPIFVVQQRRRIVGMQACYADGYGWQNRNEPEDIRYEEARPEDSGMWHRLWYRDIWEFVTACFTEAACADYIACNGHNLKDPRIFAEGSYRNAEFRAVREFLRSSGVFTLR